MNKCVVLAGLILSIIPQVVVAQGTGIIYGTVHDNSGAVVPGARIVIRKTETGLTRQMSAGADGGFVFTQLPTGVYEVQAEAPGFKKRLETGIELRVDENRQVNLRLELGSMTESITVAAEATQVETRSAALKEVVDSRRIVDLPLNGRNALQLQFLLPGAGPSQGRGQGQTDMLSINGSTGRSNNYQLDNGDNHDPYFNQAGVFPSPDALEEFAIQTSSYGADRGRNAGAFVTAVTRSGTNDFHGAVFEFLRNEDLNARNFFSNTIPPFRRNQFGGTLGGPVRRNKLFFFVSYQGTYERSDPGAKTGTMPSAAMRTGDLSELRGSIRDPKGGLFPGNRIPASRIYAPGIRYMEAFVPLPNRPDNLLSFASQQKTDDHQGVAKADYIVSERHQLSGRILKADNLFQEATGNLPNFFALLNYKNWNVTGTHTWTPSPVLLNMATLTWNDIAREQLSVVPGNKSWADFGAAVVRGRETDLPVGQDTNVNGYFYAFSRYPLSQYKANWQVSDSLSWSRGGHMLKMGMDYRRHAVSVREFYRGDPAFVFRNTFTGNAFADYLLGLPSTFVQQSGLNNDPRTNEISAYVQDDWRVNRRLTLNLGLRWDPWRPFTDTENRIVQFNPGQKSTVYPTAPAGLVYVGDANTNNALLDGRGLNFGPRFGLALDLTGNGRSSLRIAYGVFHGSVHSWPTNGIGNNQPFTMRLNVANPTGGMANPYSNTGNPYPYRIPSTPGEKRNFQFVVPATASVWDLDFRNHITQQWNFTLQRQAGAGWILTAAYVGSKTNHVSFNYESNPAVYGRPGRTTDSRRIYAPDFGAITRTGSRGNSLYHSLQLSANRRLTSNFTLLAGYTWAKSIDDASGANPFNFRASRGRGDYDAAHRLVASYIYALPKLASWSPAARMILGNWETNGIVTLQSGTPFNLNSGRDNSASGVNQDRPDLIGDPYLPADRPRGDLIARYFNTAAFALNAPGTFGSFGRNVLCRPGLISADLGLVKNVPLTERWKLQLRGEFFNALNRVNLGAPNGTFGNANFGRISSAGDPRVVQVAMKIRF